MSNNDKRTYKSLKEHGNDISYENEVHHSIKEDRGSSDLTLKIDKLEKENYQLKKDNAMVRETCQVDLLVKDQEIGRLMKKINELTSNRSK
tara:strand:- start:199 stop:471 length:273 start_codon:yes stop_codon:yes gene_type:complete